MDVRFVSAGLACCLLAAIEYFYVAPRLLRLPADYSSETSFSATSRSRQHASAPWTASSLVARRVDQMLVSSADHGILQGDMHWTNTAGQVEFETSAIFGIDRHTRANIPGYGDSARRGAFLFPLHTQPTNYRYWDTQFIGHCDAVFRHTARVGTLDVLVFSFTAKALDETRGYSHLPDVPERYRVLTNAAGTLWIEPVSGIVVDYEEEGISYLADKKTLQRVADIYQWKDRLSPQSRLAKSQQASSERLGIAMLERWIPTALLLLAAILVVVGSSRTRPASRKLVSIEQEQP